MPVSCPDFRQSVLVGPDNHPSSAKGPACDTAPSVMHGDTLEYRPHKPPVPDRFQLLERVGVGAFGAVWKAHDKGLDRRVAIKVPRDGRFDTREAKRFLQEARTASQLKHPNIVTVHEVGRYREGIYIVGSSGFRCRTRETRPSGRRRSVVGRRYSAPLLPTPDSGPRSAG